MSPGRPRRYFKALASRSRLGLLHELQTRGALTVAALAAATGLHPNTAREHLHRLVDVGLVRADPIPRMRRGRPELLYRPADPARAPKPGAVRAGGQLGALAEHMRECGFDAEIAPGARCMTMRDCPFAGMSEGDPQVCQVHRALIEGVLRSAEGPVRAGELHRLSGERECTLELARVEV